MNENIRYIGKVKIDMSAYNANDTYSDGAVEDMILNFARAGHDLNELARADFRFPVLVHCSELRKHLLEWLPIQKNDSVLEIGCGCGALTNCTYPGGGGLACS